MVRGNDIIWGVGFYTFCLESLTCSEIEPAILLDQASRVQYIDIFRNCRTSYAALSSSSEGETKYVALGLSRKMMTKSGKLTKLRKNRLFFSVSKNKRFTYFIFSRSCCFVSSCLADCGSGLLIAVIDTEESDASCQKPQKKKERTLSLLSVCAGRER